MNAYTGRNTPRPRYIDLEKVAGKLLARQGGVCLAVTMASAHTQRHDLINALLTAGATVTKNTYIGLTRFTLRDASYVALVDYGDKVYVVDAVDSASMRAYFQELGSYAGTEAEHCQLLQTLYLLNAKN